MHDGLGDKRMDKKDARKLYTTLFGNTVVLFVKGSIYLYFQRSYGMVLDNRLCFSIVSVISNGRQDTGCLAGSAPCISPNSEMDKASE